MIVVFGSMTLNIKFFSNPQHQEEDEDIEEINLIESLSQKYFSLTFYNLEEFVQKLEGPTLLDHLNSEVGSIDSMEEIQHVDNTFQTFTSKNNFNSSIKSSNSISCN